MERLVNDNVYVKQNKGQRTELGSEYGQAFFSFLFFFNLCARYTNHNKKRERKMFAYFDLHASRKSKAK